MRRNAAEIVAVTLCTAFYSFLMVPAFWRAKQRTAQKRTMASMRTIATAWEARATETNTYALETGASVAPCKGNCGVDRGRVTFAELQRVLQPTYVRALPSADGWGNPWRLKTLGTTYVVRSTGSDGILDAGISDDTAETLESLAFEQDITLANGSFIRQPEGT